jgi:membrane protein YdbS with pleckstrin-like domain
MTDENDEDRIILKVVTIITIGVVVLASILALTVVALFTDRDLKRAEYLTAGAILLLASIGGVTIFSFRKRKHWQIHVDRDEGNLDE